MNGYRILVGEDDDSCVKFGLASSGSWIGTF
jgi:hypothetical protein